MSSVFPVGIDSFLLAKDEGAFTPISLTVPGSLPFQYQLPSLPKGPGRGSNGLITSSTVFIVGFKEVEGTPQASGQFNCDYNQGILTFHPADKSRALVGSFQTAGSKLVAADWNLLADAVVAIEGFCLAPFIKDSNGVKWYLKVATNGTLSTSNTP